MSSHSLENQPAVIFLHIGKTGGLTLRHILDRQVADRSRYYAEALPEWILLRNVAISEGRAVSPLVERPNWFHLQQLEAMSEAQRSRLRILYGHFHFGLHEVLPQPATYITLLRDPVDRVLSLYHHRVSKQGLSLSLEEYVRTGLDPAFSDMQTRYIAGPESTADPTAAPTPVCPRILSLAKANLESHFSVVGVTERFDEFLVLLGRRFRWTKLLYRRFNVGLGRPAASRVLPAIVDAIRERNVHDTELYRFACNLLDRQLQQADRSIGCEIRAFRRRLWLYQHTPPLVERVYRHGKRMGARSRDRILRRVDS